MNENLPLGSVIKIENRKEKYIILGKNIKHENKSYDYMCGIYPYGLVLGERLHYFQDEQVKSLCSLGNINY